MTVRESRRVAGILAGIALGLHALAGVCILTPVGARMPLAAVTALTAIIVLVAMTHDRQQRQRFDVIGWSFILWEVVVAATAAWALSSSSAIALWLLAAGVTLHVLMMIAIILVLVLIPPWRP